MSKFDKFINSPIGSINDSLMKRLPVGEKYKELLTDMLSHLGSSSQQGKAIYVVGFSTWKRYICNYFKHHEIVFIDKNMSRKHFNAKYRWLILSNRSNSEVFIWGYKAPPYIFEFLKKHNIKTKYVEDGFIRSVNLGATKEPPLSLCIDSKAPYFDSTQATELEFLLNHHDCSDELIARADEVIKTVIRLGISKYNQTKIVGGQGVYGKKTKPRVLVLGQVEDDASILYGCEGGFDNNQLVRLAVKENPDADVFYKIHPDVLNGYRQYKSSPIAVKDICHILESDISLTDALETIDHVYTITSLTGFEALMRGIKVTCVGSPFYSGWGLTDDRQLNTRRKRKLSIEQLFAIAYMVYPKYFDAFTGDVIEIEEAIEQICYFLGVQDSNAELNSTQRNINFDNIKIGVYKDKLGNNLEVLAKATHEVTKEPLVIYKALEGQFDVVATPLSNFRQKVDFSDLLKAM